MFSLLLSIFLNFSFSQVCENISDDYTSEIDKITQKAKCPTCPYDKVTDELVTQMQFDKGSADEVVKKIMATVNAEIARSSTTSPDCPKPCNKEHKAIPILKIEPQEISQEATCEDKYIKTHTLTKAFTANGSDPACHEKVSGEAGEWVKHTLVTPNLPFFLRGSATQEGVDLLANCQGACSYYSTQVFDYSYNQNNCSLNLTLIVDCGPPKLKAEFIGKGLIRDHLSCTK
ncbi:MAG: hypothetical protein KDD37_07615 [Bdellovibrionales bacterium]|nr:hypothetical protein [Bdellovibrionales bacterium]